MSTDIVISFDTTGSMSPCIAEVRRKVEACIGTLFDSIPDLRVGIVGHGDYCDGKNMIHLLDLTNDRSDVMKFIRSVPNTSGGDSDEFYEYVLRRISMFNWQADHKSIIMIADALPHEVDYSYNGIRSYLDWREEARNLANMGISIYAVEALGDRNERAFYQPLADMTNGRKLSLNQFSDAVETLIAVSFYASNDKYLFDAYKDHLQYDLKINRNLAKLMYDLDGTKYEVEEDHSGLIPVPPYRFQMVHVDHTSDIKSFVEGIGAPFRKGRGFYQFTKSETVQERKEVILRNKVTGDMFTGAEARNFIGLPYGVRGQIRPKFFEDYEVYIQSTSSNRKLVPNTKFLYEN